MSVETATYIVDLQPLNPPSADPVAQGDDHLRLIKQVLQNSFTGATRAFNIPATFSFSTNQTLVKANGEGTIYCATTGGAVTFTLPSLVSADAGWKCHFIKTSSDANPMFIKPSVGTINSGGIPSLSQARRAIPGVRVTAIWDGTNWFVTRALGVPIGSTIDYWFTNLPSGYEWPSGQTLSSAANYPEYNAWTGTLLTPDVRGSVSCALDNLGGTQANRLTATYISRNAIGALGGIDNKVLVPANLPPYTPAGTVSNGAITVTISQNAANFGGANNNNGGGGGAFGVTTAPASISASASQAASTFNGTAAPGQISQAFGLLQPTVMCAKILVVE
jgi:hypothetical protein